MAPMTSELACFVQSVHGELRGTVGVHVGDIIGAGNKDCVNKSIKTKESFQSKERIYDIVKLAGISIQKNSKQYLLHLSHCSSRLKDFLLDCSFSRI